MGTVCSIQSMREDDSRPFSSGTHPVGKDTDTSKKSNPELSRDGPQRDNDDNLPRQDTAKPISVVKPTAVVTGTQETPVQNAPPPDCHPVGGSRAVSDVKPSSHNKPSTAQAKSLPVSLKELPVYMQHVLTGHCLDELGSEPVHLVKLFIHPYRQDAEEKGLLSDLEWRFTELCSNLGVQLNVLTLDRYHSMWNLKTGDFESYLKLNEKYGVLHFHIVIIDERFRLHEIPDKIEAEHFTSLLNNTSSTENTQLLSDWFIVDETTPTCYHLKPMGKVVRVSKSTPDNSEKTYNSRMLVKTQVLDIFESGFTTEQKQQYHLKHLTDVLDVLLSIPREELGSDNVLFLTSVDPILAEEDGKGGDSTFGDSKSDKEHWSRPLIGRVSKENVLNISGFDQSGNSQTLQEARTETLKELYQLLARKIDEQVSAKQKSGRQFPQKGLHVYAAVYNEILQVFNFCKSNYKESLTTVQNDVLKCLKSYIESATDHVMVVTGVAGSGKTTLISNLAITMASSHPEWSIICRVGGLTSGSSGDLITSIIDQVALIHKLRPPCHAMSKEDKASILSDILHSLPPTSPLLLIIDGMEQFVKGDSVDWIPTKLPSNVKIILTTRDAGPLLHSLQKIVPNEEFFLTLTSMDIEKSLEICHDWFPGVTVFEEIFSNLSENSTLTPAFSPLFLLILHQFIYLCGDLNSIKCEALKDLTFLYFDRLENVFCPQLVSTVMGYLSASRYGLTEMEIVDLLSSADVSNDFKGHYPTVDFIILWKFIRPFVECWHGSVNLLVVLRPGLAMECIREKYYDTNKLSIHSNLVDYFRRVYAGLFSDVNESSSTNTKNTAKEVRIFEELPYHTFMTCDQGKFVQDFLFNAKWFVHKCQLLGVQSVIDDLTLCSDNKSPEVTRFRTALLASRHALSIDINQLALQVQTRCHNNSGSTFTDPSKAPLAITFLKDVLKLQKSRLLTSSNSLPQLETLVHGKLDGFLDKEMDADTLPAEHAHTISEKHTDCLALIPNEPDHVLGLSSTRGELTVWDINSMEVTSKLAHLDSPRNIKLFDSKRAAILCGRVVEIHDLETGEVKAKLKGVLNSTMPYFGIHDDKHIVALSRNRMYVNIMCTGTGDMVATFKVGESRFLDSLLVSGNGEMLVCGDETQKPFPLLVWNLLQRKLVHDMRIQGHEFYTAISDISQDGHYVTCVAKEIDSEGPNYVAVYDLLSGQIFKKLSPDYNTTCLCMSNKRMSVITGLQDESIIEWSLQDGTVKQETRGLGGEPKSLSLSESGDRLASVNHFSVFNTVCLYDLQQGILLGTFTPDGVVSCCQISANGNKVLIGVTGCDDIISVWSKPNTPAEQSS